MHWLVKVAKMRQLLLTSMYPAFNRVQECEIRSFNNTSKSVLNIVPHRQARSFTPLIKQWRKHTYDQKHNIIMCFSQSLAVFKLKRCVCACDTDSTTKETRRLTKTSRTVSDVSNEIRQAAESKGSNETQWKNHYFFMVTQRCRSPVILPPAAAATLRHCLNSNYSAWLISQPQSSKRICVCVCKIYSKNWFIRWLLECCCQGFKLNAQDNLIINSYF